MARNTPTKTTRQPAKRGAQAQAKRASGSTATKRMASSHATANAPSMTVPQARSFLQGKGYTVSKLSGPTAG